MRSLNECRRELRAVEQPDRRYERPETIGGWTVWPGGRQAIGSAHSGQKPPFDGQLLAHINSVITATGD